MRYVLLICDDEVDPPSTQEMGADPQHQEWEEKVRGSELWGARLRPTVNATTIRVRGGEVLVSDGPFAETKDLVGGVVVVECDNLDDVIEIAASHPYARRGSVEIRPVWE
jgi:hypothetical protein